MLVVPRFTFIKPALPMSADAPPCGPDWVHEIKHDGYSRETAIASVERAANRCVKSSGAAERA
jgi:hypothetical protein